MKIIIVEPINAIYVMVTFLFSVDFFNLITHIFALLELKKKGDSFKLPVLYIYITLGNINFKVEEPLINISSSN